MYIYNKLCTYIYFYFKIIIYLLGQKKIGKNVLNNVSYFQTASSEKSQNIRKAPSKPQGKFFLTSPKERLKNQKKNSKLAKLKRTEDSWFEMDSIFGFEDQSYKIDLKFAWVFPPNVEYVIQQMIQLLITGTFHMKIICWLTFKIYLSLSCDVL